MFNGRHKSRKVEAVTRVGIREPEGLGKGWLILEEVASFPFWRFIKAAKQEEDFLELKSNMIVSYWKIGRVAWIWVWGTRQEVKIKSGIWIPWTKPNNLSLLVEEIAFFSSSQTDDLQGQICPADLFSLTHTIFKKEEGWGCLSVSVG